MTPDPKHTTFNCAGQTLDLSTPVIMGILNLTADSFYNVNSFTALKDQLMHTDQMINEGATIIDIGAISSRPGSDPVEEQEECARLFPALKAIKEAFPETIVSVDTYRSEVARICIDLGAGIINDIYGGRFDGGMIPLVQSAGIPYIMMHMQGTPQTMQINPVYRDVVEEVSNFFKTQLAKFNPEFTQVILDPGFGFGKSVQHNFQLLSSFSSFKKFGLPLMAGISRKSMISIVLGINPVDALNGTTVLNTLALLKGADILRVHDVKEAAETVRLLGMLGDDGVSGF